MNRLLYTILSMMALTGCSDVFISQDRINQPQEVIATVPMTQPVTQTITSTLTTTTTTN